MSASVVRSQVARQRHQCDLCLRIIAPGQRYNRAAVFEAGEAYTWREHEECRAEVEASVPKHEVDEGLPIGALSGSGGYIDDGDLGELYLEWRNAQELA